MMRAVLCCSFVRVEHFGASEIYGRTGMTCIRAFLELGYM